MPEVKFTSALQRFFPDLTHVHIQGNTIAEIVEGVEQQFPGIKGYLLEEDGSLRQHVNIFLKEEMIKDRMALTDAVNEKDEVLIFQALSGG